jgi:hypothetical protein
VKVKISRRALIQRINRRLRPGRKLRVSRGVEEQQVGRYYVVDPDEGSVIQRMVDIEGLGRSLGVLRGWEELEGSGVA